MGAAGVVVADAGAGVAGDSSDIVGSPEIGPGVGPGPDAGAVAGSGTVGRADDAAVAPGAPDRTSSSAPVAAMMPFWAGWSRPAASAGRRPVHPTPRSQPGTGIRPLVGWSAPRSGTAPACVCATPPSSASVTCTAGATIPRTARAAAPRSGAVISPISAVIVVSSAASPVQRSAATCPEGVTDPSAKWPPGITGPLPVSRRVIGWFSAPRMRITSVRVVNSVQPSGPR